MAGKINGFDYLKEALKKLHVSQEDINKLDKEKLQSIFKAADYNNDGTVESKEFFKALAENFNVTNITPEQYEDPDTNLEGEYAEAFNAVKDFANLDGNKSDVSVDDISKADEEIEETASTPDTATTPDTTAGTEPVADNKDTVSPVNLNGNETMDELQSARTDTLNELSAAEQEKWNNEDVKNAEKALDEANEDYAKAIEEMESEDEEVQEKIDEIKEEKAENDEAISNQQSTIDSLHSDISAKQSQEPQQSQFMKTITKEDGTTETVPDVEAYNAAHSQWAEEMQVLQDKLQEAEEKLQELEQKREEIDEKLQTLLEEQGDKIKNKEEVEKAKKKYDEAKQNLQTAREALTQLDANINQLRQNLSTYDTAINKKRAEELKSAKKDDENNPWKKTDFSSYPPETIAKIAEEYGESFYEDAGEFLSADKEEDAKQYEAITGALVSQAGSNEHVMKMLTDKMGKAAEEGDTRTLDALMKAGRKNASELQAVIDKYNSLNDTAFSDVIRNSEKINNDLKNTYLDALKQVEENALKENIDKALGIMYGSEDKVKELQPQIDENKSTWESKFGEAGNSDTFNKVLQGIKDGNFESENAAKAALLWAAGGDFDKMNEFIKNDIQFVQNSIKLVDTLLGSESDFGAILKENGEDKDKQTEAIEKSLNQVYGIDGDNEPEIPEEYKDEKKIQEWETKYGTGDAAVEKIVQDFANGNITAEEAKYAMLHAEGGSVKKLAECISGKVETVKQIDETIMSKIEKKPSSEEAESGPKKPEEVPLGWQTDENGYIVSDERGIKLKASSKEDVDKLYPDNKVEDGAIFDKEGKAIGRTDSKGNYYLFDIPEGWSIDEKKGNLKDDKGQELRLITNVKDYTVNDDGKIVKDGKEIGRVVENADGTKSYYINIIEDKRIPEYWQHLADDRFFDTNGRELKESTEAGLDALDPTGETQIDPKTGLIYDSAGKKVLGIAIPYKNEKGEDAILYFQYLEPFAGDAPKDTEGTQDPTTPTTPTTPTGPTGPTGPGDGDDSTTPSVTPSTEPSTTPSTEPVDHQGIWDKYPEEGTKAHDIMKDILDALKSGDKKKALEKLKQMLANPELSLDERIQILNAIAKEEPELLKELSKEEDNGLNDDFANMLAEMTKEDSNYTVDDMLKFEDLFRTTTGQQDAKLSFSTEAEEGEVSAQEQFYNAVIAMFAKATPEEIQKMNDSKTFNLENNLPELLKYKDKDGNSLFSSILGQYSKNEYAKKYITDNPDFATKLSEKYIKDGTIDYETFFEDMLGSKDLDTTEERKAAIYYMTTKGDLEKYLTERLDAGENDSYKLRVLLKVLGNEHPGWG